MSLITPASLITPYYGTSPSHLQSLILMQKRIIRIISNSLPRDHTQPLFKALGLLKITDMNKFNNTIEYFKRGDRHPCNPVHNHLTRNRYNYIPPRRNTALAKRAFFHLAPIYYHQLPNHLKSIPTLNSFKRQLKTHILSSY